jgi:hypothetical protein
MLTSVTLCTLKVQIRRQMVAIGIRERSATSALYKLAAVIRVHSGSKSSLCVHSRGSEAECTQVNRGVLEVLKPETMCILLRPCFPVFIAVLFLEVRRMGAFILLPETTYQTWSMHQAIVSGFSERFGTSFCKHILYQ